MGAMYHLDCNGNFGNCRANGISTRPDTSAAARRPVRWQPRGLPTGPACRRAGLRTRPCSGTPMRRTRSTRSGPPPIPAPGGLGNACHISLAVILDDYDGNPVASVSLTLGDFAGTGLAPPVLDAQTAEDDRMAGMGAVAPPGTDPATGSRRPDRRATSVGVRGRQGAGLKSTARGPRLSQQHHCREPSSCARPEPGSTRVKQCRAG